MMQLRRRNSTPGYIDWHQNSNFPQQQQQPLPNQYMPHMQEMTFNNQEPEGNYTLETLNNPNKMDSF